MKRSRKKDFLKALNDTPIITTVCTKVGITRQTFYRWLEEDNKFKLNYEKSLKKGLDHVNDLAESKLITKINDSDMGAIKYWLNSRHKSYITPRRPVHFLNKLIDEEVTAVEIKIINKNKD